jgi:histidine triad (HIT) family protein
MSDCIFCKIVRGEAKSWKVDENERAYAFLDINPVNEYHTLVISKTHYENIFDVPEEELIEVMRVVKKLANHYKDHLGIEHVQIINCAGVEAQQDVFRLHFHIVPRKMGDGQDVKWTTHPEWRERFDELLGRI